MARHIRTSEEMFPIVEAYLDRDETKKAFCARHRVPASVLSYWVKKYRQQETAGFIEITPPRPPAERALLEVVYPHGVRLRLFMPVAPSYLEPLLRLEATGA